jgi:hypothetical protein
MGKMIVVTSMIDGSSKAVNGATLADSMYNGWLNGTEKWQAVNAFGQSVAAVVGIGKLLRPIGIQANTFAATTVFIQITLDVKAGKDVKAGDVLTLIGNISGIIGTILFLSGTVTVWGPLLTAVGVATSIGAILDGPAGTGIKEWVKNMQKNFWDSVPLPDLHDMYYPGVGLPLRSRADSEAIDLMV